MNALEQENRIITDKFEAYELEDQLFYIHYFKDAQGQLEDVEQILELQNQLKVDTDWTRLMHAEKFVSITKEAREFVEQTAPTVKAEAYVIPSLSQKIIFNLYVKFRRNKHVIKAFDNLEDALEFLRKQ